MARKVVRGLRNARFQFTDMMDAARAGEEVIIIEVGHNRQSEIAYRLVRIQNSEISGLTTTDPQFNIPKPGDVLGILKPGNL